MWVRNRDFCDKIFHLWTSSVQLQVSMLCVFLKLLFKIFLLRTNGKQLSEYNCYNGIFDFLFQHFITQLVHDIIYKHTCRSIRLFCIVAFIWMRDWFIYLFISKTIRIILLSPIQNISLSEVILDASVLVCTNLVSIKIKNWIKHKQKWIQLYQFSQICRFL